jgi:TP901 family phage tail tape measure protein
MAEDISTLVMKVKGDGIKQGATDLDKLAKAADKAEAAVKKLATSVVTTNSQFTTGTATAQAMLHAMEKLATTMAILAAQQTRVTRTQHQHNDSMREAHALARGLSGSFGALWLTYGNFAGMAVGLALGAGLKGVVTVGKDVEHTLERIRVLGESTVKDVDDLRRAVYELGQGVNGPKDVAEALSVLTMAGLSAQQALQGVGAALNLAIAGDVSIEKSASTLVQVGTALGYTADNFDHISDVIAKTAAVSMSSVDSIAGAFKSAAAVGEVYGASLQDIGLGLAAVANLGIQGTAAGTALKNFYKDLASQADKVTSTLKAMKMASSDMKDAEGHFLPLIDVIIRLDKGFSVLQEKQRSLAMEKVFGERGIKEGAALIKMLHTVSTEVDASGNAYASKLHEVNDRINKSYAFSTLAAIAMAQTTNNQLKSVGNTLQTSFARAFTEIQPQINGVSRALKEAFSSPTFIEGIKTIAVAVADATRFLAEHIKQIGYAAAAYGAWKVAQFATGLYQVATAFKVASIGAATFTAALGPIALAILAMGAAWAVYNANKDRSITNKDAAAGLSEFADGVISAAEKERRAIEMRKQNISEADIIRQQQMDDDRSAAALAVKQSERGLTAMKEANSKLYAEMNNGRKAYVSKALKENIAVTGMGNVDQYLANVRAIAKAEETHGNQVKIVTMATQALVAARKESADAADKAAQAARKLGGGSEDLNKDKDNGGVAAAYAEGLKKQDNLIKSANRSFKDEEEKLNSEFRAGRIGRIQLIEELAKKEIDTTNAVRNAIAAKIDIASRGKNKDADVERFSGDQEANEDRIAQTKIMREKLSVEEIARVQQDAAKHKVKMLEDQGQFEAAARLKFENENSMSMQRATADALAYGDVYPELWAKVEEYSQRAGAAILSGQMKDAMNAFGLAAENTGNLLKGVQTANENSSVAGMWIAASEASEQYMKNIDDLKVKQAALAALAEGGSDEDKTHAAEALKEIAALGEKHKTMWVGIGTSIGNSLEKAFGKGGKAMGDLVKASINFHKLSDKSASAQVRYYGDAADAAKGFFREGSTGYKTMEGVSKAFHAAEMAMSVVRMGRMAIEAVLNQAKGDPYSAFARMAAMAAIVGALGFAVGGGFSSNSGGRSAEDVQKTQGTGSVFGDKDAKSESIAKSLEYLESNSDVMLPLTQGMLQALRNIESSMSGLTNLVLRTDGVKDGTNLGIATGTLSKSALSSNIAIKAFDTIMTGGLLGKLSSLWGSTKSNIVDAGIKFNGKVSSLEAGQGFSQYASVDTTKKSAFGLRKKTSNNVQTQGLNSELSSQFGLVFSNLEEVLKLAGPALGKEANAISKAIDDLVINTSVSLQGLTGADLQAAINGVVSKTMDEIAHAAFPSMDAFRKVGEGYAQTVIRVASSVEQANVAMEGLGLTAIDYRNVANKQGDVAMEIARQTIAIAEGGSGVNEMLKGVGSTMGELVEMYKTLSAIRNQMNSVGLNGNGLNVNVVKGAGGTDQLGSALKSYEDNFFTDGEKAAIMLKSVTAEFTKLGLRLPANNAELRKLIESTGVGTEANSKLTGKLLVLSEAYAKLTEASAKAREDQMNALRGTISDLERFIDTIKEFRKSLLLGSLSTLKPEEKFAEAKRQYESTLQKALSGDTVAQGKVTTAASAYLEASKVVNASSEAYGLSFSQVQRDLLNLESYAGTQLTEAQKQLAALEAQVNGISTLNVTATAILDSLSGLNVGQVAMALTPVTRGEAPTPPPVVPQASPLAGQATDGGNGWTDVQQAIIDASNVNAKKMDDLYAVVYDSQAKSTSRIVEGSEAAAKTISWDGRNQVTLNER